MRRPVNERAERLALEGGGWRGLVTTSDDFLPPSRHEEQEAALAVRSVFHDVSLKYRIIFKCYGAHGSNSPRAQTARHHEHYRIDEGPHAAVRRAEAGAQS